KPSAKPVIYLTWDELMAVWDFHDPERPWLDGVRDMFCFAAFTSLRFSDVQALRWTDVEDDTIQVTTQKTRDALVIELNKWSREILSRYDKPDGPMMVFPRMTNQVANRAVKEICKACGIDSPVRVTTYKGGTRKDEVKKKYELVGTHAARRTFVVNALQMGISPTTVMAWTGHASYDAMRPYIAVVDAARALAMKGFDALAKTKPGAADDATPGAT
ncbi:MAG: site-specific integrase, partial [Bacteroidales bacterium]|nr:site-specific integrase [Bacteroidales bacterium]